eukprot:1770352-Lingulodinium_polyedra.AAC.1
MPTIPPGDHVVPAHDWAPRRLRGPVAILATGLGRNCGRDGSKTHGAHAETEARTRIQTHADIQARATEQ